jgi:predicted nucleic acid-binding protein
MGWHSGLGANAEVLIGIGDLDLLILLQYEQIKICNPTDFFTSYFPPCQ